MDREIGRLMAALAELGVASNTVVMFTSDNGYFLGERGLTDKFLMFEESIRVPLIVFDPNAPKKSRGQKLDEMALNIDLAPTVLDYGGVPVPAAVQGSSLQKLVQGEKIAWRTDVAQGIVRSPALFLRLTLSKSCPTSMPRSNLPRDEGREM